MPLNAPWDQSLQEANNISEWSTGLTWLSNLSLNDQERPHHSMSNVMFVWSDPISQKTTHLKINDAKQTYLQKNKQYGNIGLWWPLAIWANTKALSRSDWDLPLSC